MKINWTRTIPAGLVATLALDLSGLLMTGKWWDIPNLLGAKLGTGLLGGLVMHYGIGIILAAMFVAVAPSLKGPLWARALTYITVQTVMGVFLFMFPLLDLGVAGLKAGAMMPVISLARHLLYALTLSAALRSSTSVLAPANGTAPTAMNIGNLTRTD
jgi:hypothetical protein